MNYAYIRVSTDMQTVKNQKLAIKQYAKYHRIHNLKFISETVSGTKSPEKRKQSKISYIKKGRADGKTKAQLARELGCSWHCLHNFMKLKKIP